MDFMRGAALSRNGRPIIALPSTAAGGQVSRITAAVQSGAGVVTTRGHVHWVVTEYGAVDLFGKTLRERARALISVATRTFEPNCRVRFETRGTSISAADGRVSGRRFARPRMEVAMRMHIRPLTVVLASAFLASTHAALAQTMGQPERYTAVAINMNRGASGTVEIVVNRWSSDADRDKLMNILLNQGADKLLDALQDMPRVGYFRSPSSVGIDIHFARRIPGEDGGDRVILVTDRRIGFWEASNRPRSLDYPFTVIELRLNKDGEGEGKMSVATKVIPDKENNIITLENYDTQPVLLNNVKRERASR